MPRPPLELETWGKIRRTTINGKPTAVARYRDSDGVTRTMQRQGKTGAEAERRLIRAMKDRLAPAGGDLTPTSTVKQAIDAWLMEPEFARLAVQTQNRYRGMLDNIVKKGFGGVRLQEATVPRVDRFLKLVTKQNGPAQAKTTRTLLFHTFGFATRQGVMPANPIRDAAKIPQPKKRVTAPTVEDVKAIRWIMWMYDITPDKRGAVRTAELADIFDLYVGTGARTAEILSLQWDTDVDLESTPVRVAIQSTAAIGEDGKVFRQEYPKTEASDRILQLPSFAGEVLLRRRVHAYCNWVFPSATGTLRWQHNLRRNWREALAGTPYGDVTPRSLRKAVATLLKDKAKDQLGHTSDEVARRHYIERNKLAPDVSADLEAFAK